MEPNKTDNTNIRHVFDPIDLIKTILGPNALDPKPPAIDLAGVLNERVNSAFDYQWKYQCYSVSTPKIHHGLYNNAVIMGTLDTRHNMSDSQDQTIKHPTIASQLNETIKPKIDSEPFCYQGDTKQILDTLLA